MLTIDYYSDVLCIWAWIAQRRLDELDAHFGDRLLVHHHCMNVFGDVPRKMQTQWRDRGGMEGFAQHVHHAAEQYCETPLDPRAWREVQPCTSASAHLFIEAVALDAGERAATAFALRVRRAFFLEARDIARYDVLRQLLEECGVRYDRVAARLEDGTALAALASGYERARQLNLRGSPSYIMNDERQTLYGNVGYRVLSANIEELLRNVEHEASWC